MRAAILEGIPDGRILQIDLAGRTLRVFWRGLRVPQLPYAWHRYSFYAFGAGPIGFMFWPKESR